MFFVIGRHFDLVNKRSDVIALVVVGNYLIKIIHVAFEPDHAMNARENTEIVDTARPVTFDLHNHLINMQIFVIRVEGGRIPTEAVCQV